MNDTDLSWIAERRPPVPAPDELTTARARTALLEEAAAAAPPPPRRVRSRAPRAKRRRLRTLAVLVPALVLAAVILLAPGKHTPSPAGIGVSVPEAEAAPIVRLVANLRHSAAQDGDATLVIRRQYPGDGGAMIPGADLYVDGGGYFYARTPAGLPDAIASGHGRDEQVFNRELAATAKAFDGDIDKARKRLALSVLEPGTPAPAHAADRAWLDNWVWGNGLDALTAGAGRPEIRAGVLHLFASITGLTVKDTSVDNRHVLVISADVFDGARTETLTIDADTGVPIEFTGGETGKAPAMRIEYTVTRVTVAALSR
jgi:hypothetical protein